MDSALIRLLIATYFPDAEWENAWCIALQESPSGLIPGPVPIGEMACMPEMASVDASKWGLFGLLDACWHPVMNPGSPFTLEQWANVLDANDNTWMASVIWSAYGWAAWSTAPACGLTNAPGGQIPHPEGPVPGLGAYQPSEQVPNWLGIVGGIGLLGLGALYVLGARRR